MQRGAWVYMIAVQAGHEKKLIANIINAIADGKNDKLQAHSKFKEFFFLTKLEMTQKREKKKCLQLVD